jgi:hypothetical protein
MPSNFRKADGNFFEFSPPLRERGFHASHYRGGSATSELRIRQTGALGFNVFRQAIYFLAQSSAFGISANGCLAGGVIVRISNDAKIKLSRRADCPAGGIETGRSKPQYGQTSQPLDGITIFAHNLKNRIVSGEKIGF